MTDRHELDAYGRHLENRRKLKEWLEEKQAKAQQQEREQKRARLDAYLRRRSGAWLDHTSSLPPADVLADWRREYLDDLHFAEEAEREERLQKSIEENYPV